MNSSPAPQHQIPIASEKLVSGRKIFFLDLKENDRGRFMKITEDVGGRRDTIMLPMAAAREFCDALCRLAAYEAELEQVLPESASGED